MNNSTLKFVSYTLVTAVMGLSAAYFYRTWRADQPRWYFLIMALAIALLLSYNLLTRRK
ncbi:MAG: hypothetical protein RJQ14_00630 [Marinoscillum sp.]